MRSLLMSIFFLSLISACFSQNAGNGTYAIETNPVAVYAEPLVSDPADILLPVLGEPISTESPSTSISGTIRPDIIRNFFLANFSASFTNLSKQIDFKQTIVRVATGSGFKYPVEKSLSFFVQPLYQRKGEIFYSKSESKDRLYNAGIRAGFGWHIL